VRFDRESVRDIAHLGGTILGTTNRSNPSKQRTVNSDGTVLAQDRFDEVICALHAAKFDALVAVGGDGSLEIAFGLCQKGLFVVGVPKTTDNDLEATALTFGFDSAVAFRCIWHIYF
jgi:6-phosphofructokinase 1